MLAPVWLRLILIFHGLFQTQRLEEKFTTQLRHEEQLQLRLKFNQVNSTFRSSESFFVQARELCVAKVTAKPQTAWSRPHVTCKWESLTIFGLPLTPTEMVQMLALFQDPSKSRLQVPDI